MQKNYEKNFFFRNNPFKSVANLSDSEWSVRLWNPIEKCQVFRCLCSKYAVDDGHLCEKKEKKKIEVKNFQNEVWF